MCVMSTYTLACVELLYTMVSHSSYPMIDGRQREKERDRERREKAEEISIPSSIMLSMPTYNKLPRCQHKLVAGTGFVTPLSRIAYGW